jgi:hypothetical protein
MSFIARRRISDICTESVFLASFKEASLKSRHKSDIHMSFNIHFDSSRVLSDSAKLLSSCSSSSSSLENTISYSQVRKGWWSIDKSDGSLSPSSLLLSYACVESGAPVDRR